MARHKVSTTVYLERRQTEALRELSKRTGVPQSEYIRRGVDLILREHGLQMPGSYSPEEETLS